MRNAFYLILSPGAAVVVELSLLYMTESTASNSNRACTQQILDFNSTGGS